MPDHANNNYHDHMYAHILTHNHTHTYIIRTFALQVKALNPRRLPHLSNVTNYGKGYYGDSFLPMPFGNTNLKTDVKGSTL